MGVICKKHIYQLYVTTRHICIVKSTFQNHVTNIWQDELELLPDYWATVVGQPSQFSFHSDCVVIRKPRLEYLRKIASVRVSVEDRSVIRIALDIEQRLG